MKTVLFALLAAAGGYVVAQTYVSRLPDHRGLFVVPVRDQVVIPLPEPPRHTVIIVIDGLRQDGAERLAATQTIRAHGQCFTTDVGMLSVSRPVYAELSTGLEQDRTGARNNDETSPLQVESLWEVAREAGRSVRGVSELAWWQQLFPSGFSDYVLGGRDENFFARDLTADITLIHPIYLDETAHSFGGVSPQYTAAVARVDRELSPFLQQIDWQRDLVLFTADHGHRDRGGHGAPRPEIEFVLSCVGGRGVTPNAALGRFETRALAPLLSVLLGLRFPSAMRAGDDSLDQLWPITAGLPADYLAARRAAVALFRARNASAVRAWGVASGSWRDLYAARHCRQHLQWSLFALALVAATRWRKAWRSALWIAGVMVATVGLEFAVRGSFDFNAINERGEFIRGTGAACVAALAAGALLHRSISRASLLADQTALVAVVALLNLAHIAIYGWPIGFPLPEPLPFFAPFVAGIFLLLAGLWLAALAARVALGRKT